MSQTHASEDLAEMHVENIGGIDDTAVSLSPGVTSLTGRSLLAALADDVGSMYTVNLPRY